MAHVSAMASWLVSPHSDSVAATPTLPLPTPGSLPSGTGSERHLVSNLFDK